MAFVQASLVFQNSTPFKAFKDYPVFNYEIAVFFLAKKETILYRTLKDNDATKDSIR